MAPLSALALFALGLIAFRAMAAQAPAFNEDLKVTGITGDTRLSSPTDMYDRGDYLFQMGYGYVMADALTFAGIEAPTEVASLQTARERFERARDLLAESLRQDPADTFTWLYYAQTLSALNNVAGTQMALEMSWRQGPNTHPLAHRRLSLATFLREQRSDPDLYETEVEADRKSLETYNPRLLEQYLAQR